MSRRKLSEKRTKGSVHRKVKQGRLSQIAGKHGSRREKDNPVLSGHVGEIIGYLYEEGGEAGFQEILQAVGGQRGMRKEIVSILEDLSHRHILKKTGKKNYKLDPLDFVEGELSVNPRGFAFAAPLKTGKPGISEKDIFIPAAGIGSALHGDQVLLRIIRQSRGRSEARVVKVLHRKTSHIVGIYRQGRQGGYVVPEDERFPFTVDIVQDSSGGAENGEAVMVELMDWGQEKARATGRITEILGDPDSTAVQMAIVIRKFDLPHEFSEQSIEQAASFSEKVDCSPEDRTNLRDIFHVTIDGETARDFDDAVSVLKTRTGFKLYVSIADVSHYIKPGSPLDMDAWLRGTSVYFPTGVLPMLPERLSNDLCSLKPDVDRYAFTAILDFDRSGRRKKIRFVKSVIRSARRLTYTMVRQILVDKDPAVRRNNKELHTPLKWMAELGTELEKGRIARGSMGFEIPESFIEIGSDDTVTGIGILQRNLAHKIIEEFMLAANEAVAETFTKQHFAAMYRIHQSPDVVKVAEFAEFVQSMGYELPREKYSSKWFNKLLDQTRDTPREYLISNLILRVMQQARYSPENIGHFGLAASYYTHFTSPIRRYPDLMVHRSLKQLLWPKKEKAASPIPLDEAGEFLSKRERVAVDAERQMVDRLTVRYLADKIGENFSGIVSGITSFGLFIQLTDTMISGAVAVTDLPADGYQFHEKQHSLIAERTGTSYQVGDLVTVQLISVDKRRQRINFIFAEDEAD